MEKIKLTLLIPAYNEEKIIKATLDKIRGFLSKESYPWEILVVDDGSNDRTPEMVNETKDPRIKLVGSEVNEGKGAALRKGMEESRGKYLIFSDADLSVPIENIRPFLKELQKGTEVVIGSRRIQGAKIEVHQPLIRENMGRFFTFLTRIVTGVNLADFTCGFKGFEKEAGKKIFRSSLIDRWSYDAEIIFLANKFGYKIKELPVSWKNRIESRVSLGSAVVTSFRDLLIIRINDLMGKYHV